ncbi:hypothetical protein KW795_01635 [Candidatus Microgenomates bacterium]|nr:hypothetical protein [Candidatus Microgenomates bacterium]
MLTKTDLQAISKIVKFETDPLKIQIKKVDKKLDQAIDFLDRDIVNLQKRVDRVEDNLELPPLN